MAGIFNASIFNKLVFNTGATTSPARSGWYRLLLSELQEASLLEGKAVKEKPVAVAIKMPKMTFNSDGSVTVAAPPVKKVKPKKTPEVIDEATEEELPKTPLKPMYQHASAPVPSVEPWALSVASEMRDWVRSIAVPMQRVLQEQKAANDEDEEDEVISMLLLAA